MIWQRISTLPIMASFRPLMFSMIAPAILFDQLPTDIDQ
jgi:hypothetical protein